MKNIYYTYINKPTIRLDGPFESICLGLYVFLKCMWCDHFTK